MMKANVAFTTFAVLVVSPAFGQQSDTSNCSALADKYQRYVGNTAAQHRGQQRDATIDAAIAGCTSKSAASIPVLEKALKDAKVDLPTRSQ